VAATCLLAAIIYAQVHFDFNSTPEKMNKYAVPGIDRDIYYYTISITGVAAVAFLLLFISWILGIVAFKGVIVAILACIGCVFGLATCIMCGIYAAKISGEGTNSELSSTRNSSSAQKYVKAALQDWYDYAYNTRCQEPEYKEYLKDVLGWDQIKFGEEATSNFQYVNFIKPQQQSENDDKKIQKVIHFITSINYVYADCGQSGVQVPIASNVYNYSKVFEFKKVKNFWPTEQFSNGYYSVGLNEGKFGGTRTPANNWAIAPTTGLNEVTIISGKYDNTTDYTFSANTFPPMYNKISKELADTDKYRSDGIKYRFAEKTKPDKSIGSFSFSFLKSQLEKKMDNAFKLYFQCTKEPTTIGEATGTNDKPFCSKVYVTDPDAQKNAVDPYNGYFLFQTSGAQELKNVYQSISSAPYTGELPPLKNKGASMKQHDVVFSWNSVGYAQIGYALCGVLAGGIVLLIVGILLVFKDGGDDTNGPYQRSA